MKNEFKTYIGAKIIRALPMNHGEFLASKGVSGSYEGQPADGYMVIYPDGYTSWSPKEVFEETYRLINVGERNLVERG